MYSTEARASQQVLVELPAHPSIEPRLTRRLVELEVRDISVPPSAARAVVGGTDVTLYYRVLVQDGVLIVELWERGEAAGARRISPEGNPALVARRIALAAAELARRLASARRIEADWLERERRLEEEIRAQELERAARSRLAFLPLLNATVLPDGAWFAGPSVGVQVNRDQPFRWGFELGWQTGSLHLFDDSAPLQWLEATVHPAAVVHHFGRGDLGVGLLLGASVLHVGEGVTVDGISEEHDTWSARAGAEVRAAFFAGDHLALETGIAGGLLLRPVPFERDGQSEKLNGAFIGLTAGARLW